MPEPGQPTIVKRALRLALKLTLALVVFAVTLLVLEGAASVVVLARELDESGVTLAEHRHTTYDPLLGWCNAPSTSIPDMYGPGASLHINAQRFRATREYAPEVPPGRLRVVCSGDSFTLGYGVDDADTWVQQLEQLEPRFETVNMGQGGYGVDQAFLWYRRDAAELAHDIHLFALISGDFTRAQRSHNYGLPKPVLAVRNDTLETRNVPVSRLPYLFPFVAHNRRRFAELSAVQFVQQLSEDSPPSTVAMSDEELRRVAVAMFRELRRLNEERGSRLIVVHLPMRKAFFDDETTEWESFLARELDVLGVPYLDLLPELRRLSRSQLAELFIKKGEVDYPGAAGHFSARGNLWAARRILALLERLPAVREELSRL